MQALLVLACLVMWVQVFIILAFALRLVPTILRWAGDALRVFLMLSYRAYQFLLLPIARWVQSAFGINLLVGLWRVVTVTALSLLIGLVIIAVTPLVISLPALGVCLAHGLLVGLIWDEAEHLGHLHLGARLQ
jgi:hypothetical protein